ncbi:MAG: efflux RND transporter periplasmic adaptor subunit [Bryobacterales bacterium]|nr:efflux RND transporter periplasmic adaptor subunit [Bryobacterales bacterium]
MRSGTAVLLVILATLGSAGCDVAATRVSAVAEKQQPSPAVTGPRTDSRLATRRVRATGVIQALRYRSVQVPQIAGQQGRMTLTSLTGNGLKVKQGAVLAEFDSTQQEELALTAEAKVDDLNHQIEQKRAENLSKAAERSAALKQADADKAKALLQLRKGPLLSEIDRHKNEVRVRKAEAEVESLQKSSAWNAKAEAASLRILELQRDRQAVALERAKSNLERLVVKAGLDGMVALENIWRSGSMGPPQEGDQVWTGMPILKIFDPTDMVVQVQVNEPDGTAMVPGTKAKVYLDAYPEAVFDAVFESASPVAAPAALGSPVRTFSARFRLQQVDSRLLPDLSAAIDIEVPLK